jgi:hypothetical protein
VQPVALPSRQFVPLVAQIVDKFAFLWAQYVRPLHHAVSNFSVGKMVGEVVTTLRQWLAMRRLTALW